MDIEKLKVPELRAELANRGLDTKGTKPVRFFLTYSQSFRAVSHWRLDIFFPS